MCREGIEKCSGFETVHPSVDTTKGVKWRRWFSQGLQYFFSFSFQSLFGWQVLIKLAIKICYTNINNGISPSLPKAANIEIIAISIQKFRRGGSTFTLFEITDFYKFFGRNPCWSYVIRRRSWSRLCVCDCNYYLFFVYTGYEVIFVYHFCRWVVTFSLKSAE